MLISVINLTNNEISDADLLTAIRAINQQIEYDFAPYWGMPATLRLEGSLSKQPRENVAAAVMRGDAVIYVVGSISDDNTEGYHERNYGGIPCGFVSTEASAEMGDPWSVTLSHETLELIADPQANNYVLGASPRDPLNRVFFWFEMCDPVSGQTYKIGDVALQNFLLPPYFEPPVPGARTNFLGIDLEPFGIAPNGYVGFYNPKTGQQETTNRDVRGKVRLEIKSRWASSRSARRGNV